MLLGGGGGGIPGLPPLYESLPGIYNYLKLLQQWASEGEFYIHRQFCIAEIH